MVLLGAIIIKKICERGRMSALPVYRKNLKTPTEFRDFIHAIGRPKFAITDSSDGDCEFLQKDEWIFSDDSDLLMQALFNWQEQGCRLVYQEPSEEFDGEWMVVGLPDYFNDAAALVRVAPDNESSESDDARKAFFNEVRENSYTYGFFSLNSESYDDYLKDWNLEYDKQVNPEKYRAKKYSGVISDFHGTKIGREPMRYYLSLENGDGGRILETQLRVIGINPDNVIGMSCVVNGLDEVERIGDRDVPREQRR